MTRPFTYALDFRGRWCCPCQHLWLPVFERVLQHDGVLKPGQQLPIMQLIGGAPESAGFHAKGGCADWRHLGDHAVWVARQMGADATWHRPAGWDGPGSAEHDHSALTGCPHLPDVVVRNQVTAVRNGYDGLGHLGESGRDTGPRPLSGRTFQQGIEWAEARMGNAPMTPAERKELDDRFDKIEGRVKRLEDESTGSGGADKLNTKTELARIDRRLDKLEGKS